MEMKIQQKQVLKKKEYNTMNSEQSQVYIASMQAKTEVTQQAITDKIGALKFARYWKGRCSSASLYNEAQSWDKVIDTIRDMPNTNTTASVNTEVAPEEVVEVTATAPAENTELVTEDNTSEEKELQQVETLVSELEEKISKKKTSSKKDEQKPIVEVAANTPDSTEPTKTQP